MKKRIIALILVLGLAIVPAGCGNKEAADNTETGTSGESTENTDTGSASIVNAEGLVKAVDTDNIEEYVTLGDYKNLEVEVQKYEVTDEVVENYIKQQLIYMAEEITEDRPVQEDDTVNIDYTGYMDGEEFSGGSAQGTDLLIGSGQFIDGFESGLIGKSKGEEVTLDLTFPDPYSNNPDYSGKAVQFVVTINSISAAPEFTDEWVAENTDVDTVDEYREEVRNSLEENADMQYMSQMKSALFEELVNTSEIKEYPEEFLQAEKDKINARILQMYAEPSGMTLEEYWEAQGISEEDADSMISQNAQDYLEQNMIVQAVFDAEGISLTEEEYNEEKEAFAKEYGFADAEALESAYSDVEMVKANVLWNKACTVLSETAKVTDVAVEDESLGE